jgi:hypothetical protein
VPTPNMESQEERRDGERRPCHCPCLVCFERKHFDGLEGSVQTQGAIRDLSECGVGLVLRLSVAPGVMLTVSPLGRATRPLPPLRVVRCVPVGPDWHHGCLLDQRLAEEELRDWLN